MDYHRRPDGILELRVSIGEWARAWKTSSNERHMTFSDPGVLVRPGVWWMTPEDETVLTPYPALWEMWYRTQKQGGVQPTSRERLCRQCGHILRLSKELSDVWTFWCEVCRHISIQDKQTVGGTVGAGEGEKT